MGKLLKKIALFIIPFIVVFALFLAFDPYNYFGQGSKISYMSKPLSTMRELVREQSENIILGDSHMANFNVGYIEEISGERYTMLAFGGGTMPENIDEFWYAAEHTTLKKVVFGVEFYNMNTNHGARRFVQIIPKIQQPLKFLGDYSYWLEAAENMKSQAMNGLAKLLNISSLEVFVDDPSSLSQDVRPSEERNEYGERIDLVNYSGIIYGQCQGYRGPLDYLVELEKIIDYCDANGIEIIFVIPNSSAVLWEDVIYPLEIDFYIEIYKDFLKSRATVYDFEFYNDYAKDDSNFLDGMHLVLEQKLWLTRVVFGGEETPYCERTTPEQYLAAKQAAQEAAQGEA